LFPAYHTNTSSTENVDLTSGIVWNTGYGAGHRCLGSAPVKFQMLRSGWERYARNLANLQVVHAPEGAETCLACFVVSFHASITSEGNTVWLCPRKSGRMPQGQSAKPRQNNHLYQYLLHATENGFAPCRTCSCLDVFGSQCASANSRSTQFMVCSTNQEMRTYSSRSQFYIPSAIRVQLVLLVSFSVTITCMNCCKYCTACMKLLHFQELLEPLPYFIPLSILIEEIKRFFYELQL
ncbi:hypothetical protein OESDEN_20405, partial [Oesophagostomum dentatum]